MKQRVLAYSQSRPKFRMFGAAMKGASSLLILTLGVSACTLAQRPSQQEEDYIGLPTGTVIGSRTGDRLPGDAGANKGGSPGDTPPKESPTPTPVPPPADPSAIKNAPGLFIWHYYTSGKYTAIEAMMTVTHAPAPSNEGGIIFWANQVFFEKEAGYVGLQIVGEKKKAIFSLWTALSSDKGNPFTGEGDGYQYLVEYDWQLGRTYKLGIQMTGEDATGRYWNGYVIDTMTGIRTDLATHKAPLSMGFIRNNVAWTEYASNGTCVRPYTRFEFANSTCQGSAIQIHLGSAKRIQVKSLTEKRVLAQLA